MKSAEELKAIKAEYESLKKKLSELTEEEMSQITGGTSSGFSFDIPDETKQYEIHVYPEEKKKFN